MNLKRVLLTLTLTAFVCQGAFAQRATPEQMGKIGDRPDFHTLHFQSNLGSFKIYGQGTVTVNFSGTILVSRLKGDISFTGAVKKEFEGLDRVILHGTGQVKVSGVWRAVQWFGTDMSAVWYGAGFVRILGEFDKNLYTGEYWYDDAEDKKPWQSMGIEIYLPERKRGLAPGVVPQKRGGGG